jgi:hypothetical protein
MTSVLVRLGPDSLLKEGTVLFEKLIHIKVAASRKETIGLVLPAQYQMPGISVSANAESASRQSASRQFPGAIQGTPRWPAVHNRQSLLPKALPPQIVTISCRSAGKVRLGRIGCSGQAHIGSGRVEPTQKGAARSYRPSRHRPKGPERPFGPSRPDPGQQPSRDPVAISQAISVISEPFSRQKMANDRQGAADETRFCIQVLIQSLSLGDPGPRVASPSGGT